MSSGPPHFYVLPALVALIIIAALVFASVREKRKQELIARFLDKGQDIPPSLLPLSSAQRDGRRGVWLASLGFGLGLTLYITSADLRLSAWCLIPLFLAAASFINAKLFGTHR